MQQLVDVDRKEVLAFYISLFLCRKEFNKAFLQKINELRLQSPHVHGNKGVFVDRINRSVFFFNACALCGLYNVFRLVDTGQVSVFINDADTSCNTAVVT